MSAPLKIDLNCDLGEASLKEAPYQIGILDYVTSCNIATGFHAGDPETIYRLIGEAHRKGVAIGAHPSYPDRVGFGRVTMKMTEKEWMASLFYQISAIRGMCELVGAEFHHVKLHGALYHDVHYHKRRAELFVRNLKKLSPAIAIYGLERTFLSEIAQDLKVPFIPEGFSDRRYQADGRLVPRDNPNAVISDIETSQHQVLEMIRNERVFTAEGKAVPVRISTLCIHGDHEGALERAAALSDFLSENGIVIEKPEVR